MRKSGHPSSAEVEVPLPGFEHLVPSGPERETLPRSGPDLLPSPAVVARFWQRVVKSPNCWLFLGSISSPDGYGRVTWQHKQAQRTMTAHRFAMLITSGELPAGAVCEHACNEPLCVRPDAAHVHASTQSENLRYAVSLGRHRGNAPGAGDERGRAGRSRAVRAALRDGWDADRYREAVAGHRSESATMPLF